MIRTQSIFIRKQKAPFSDVAFGHQVYVQNPLSKLNVFNLQITGSNFDVIDTGWVDIFPKDANVYSTGVVFKSWDASGNQYICAIGRNTGGNTLYNYVFTYNKLTGEIRYSTRYTRSITATIQLISGIEKDGTYYILGKAPTSNIAYIYPCTYNSIGTTTISAISTQPANVISHSQGRIYNVFYPLNIFRIDNANPNITITDNGDYGVMMKYLDATNYLTLLQDSSNGNVLITNDNANLIATTNTTDPFIPRTGFFDMKNNVFTIAGSNLAFSYKDVLTEEMKTTPTSSKFYVHNNTDLSVGTDISHISYYDQNYLLCNRTLLNRTSNSNEIKNITKNNGEFISPIILNFSHNDYNFIDGTVSGVPSHTFILSSAFSRGNNVTDYYIYRTTNGGNTFTTVLSGSGGTNMSGVINEISGFGTTSAPYFAPFAYDGANGYMSANGGITWSSINPGMGGGQGGRSCPVSAYVDGFYYYGRYRNNGVFSYTAPTIAYNSNITFPSANSHNSIRCLFDNYYLLVHRGGGDQGTANGIWAIDTRTKTPTNINLNATAGNTQNDVQYIYYSNVTNKFYAFVADGCVYYSNTSLGPYQTNPLFRWAVNSSSMTDAFNNLYYISNGRLITIHPDFIMDITDPNDGVFNSVVKIPINGTTNYIMIATQVGYIFINYDGSKNWYKLPWLQEQYPTIGNAVNKY